MRGLRSPHLCQGDVFRVDETRLRVERGVMSQDAFVAALTETIPPRPAEMDRMVEFNLGR